MVEGEDRPKEETTEETVQRFIKFTKKPFDANAALRAGDIVIEWGYVMDTLYGNPDLMRINKDESLRGVKGIQTTLEQAAAKGGLPGLKMEFLEQTLTHTKIRRMKERALPPLVRILDFK